MTNELTTYAPQSRPKAYSYLRFSTPEQSKGDSFRRQMSMATAYAAQHGLVLDQDLTFHDVGVSAYRGQNADAGRLAYFMEAVRSGQVPQGSVLLVEQLDRISRLVPRRALRVLEDIVETGVSVVTLTDGREYTARSLDADAMDLLVSIMTFMRANEESATKARRLKAAWEGKRAKISTQPLTARAPAWLRLSKDRSRYEVIEERAALVRRIFQMTLDGVGQHKIAATFNEEGHETWGRGAFWHRSYIAKVLASEAVTGRFQPHLSEYIDAKKARVPVGEPVEGYFPAVVPIETFSEAQALRTLVGAPQRGRHAHRPISHSLAGLATCGLCGAKMTRVQKGRRSRPAYVCSRAKGKAGCTYRSLRCDLVDAALLRALPERLEAFEGAGVDEDLDGALRGADEAVDRLRRKARRTADRLLEMADISGTRSRAATIRLQETEAELAVAEGILRGLLERKDALTGLTMGARVQKALEALQRPEDERTAADVNLALRRVFDRAVFMGQRVEAEDAEGYSKVSSGSRWWAISLEWKHGGECLVPISVFDPFHTGAEPGWLWQDAGEADEQLDQAG